MLDDFLHRLCCCPWGADLLAGWLALTLLLGVLVVAGNQLLSVSDDLGFMAFLNGGQLTEPLQSCGGVVQTGDRSALVHACWTPRQQHAVPWLLLLDTLWGLVYAGFLAALYARLLSELIADRQGARCGRWRTRQAPGHELGQEAPAATPDEPGRARLPLLLLALLPAALLAADWVENWQAWRLAPMTPPVGYGAMNTAAAIKGTLAWIAIGVAAALFMLWFFGLLSGFGTTADGRRRERTLLRLAVARIILRSRYVLAILVLFGFLSVGMDQSRDVLVGMAQALVPLPEALASDGQAVWAVLAIVLSVVAVWMLAYACWLWSRIPARMRSLDAEVMGDGLPPSAPDAASPAPTAAAPGQPRAPDGRDQFAKWWARWLGLVPLLVLIALAGMASGDAARVAVAGAVAQHAATGDAGSWAPVLGAAQGTAEVLFWFAVATALLAVGIQVGFVKDTGRETSAQRPLPGPCGRGVRKGSLYYNVVGLEDAAAELTQRRYRFPLWLTNAPLSLPLLALAGFELVRGLNLALDGRVPVTVAVIALALTLWTCVLGLLAQAAQRQGIPWVLALLILAGILSGLGLTDTHRILTRPFATAGDGVILGMWLAQLALAALLAIALVWSCNRLTAPSRDQEPLWMRWIIDRLTWAPRGLARVGLVAAEHRGARGHLAVDVGFFLLLTVLALPVLWVADRLLGAPPPGDTARSAAHDRGPVALDDAIAAWTNRLLAETPGSGMDAVPVYFVSAEGGGIRAAYWTALALERLERKVPQFEHRTFSVSGVSGGSIGAAAWTVCRREAAPCIDRLAEANLLTPLLSAWLFEDVLGVFLPTTLALGPLPWCATPGCAMLSRGLKFERELEAALPALRRPVLEANATPPYLFLNSTRVEDGSRAIASPIRIDAADFPSSIGQATVLGPDLPLSTAAHNSARFTYVNAIGAAGTQDGRTFVDRYHLADGGYFDNSGGHTSADVIRAFTRCLFSTDEPNPCGIDPLILADARTRLLPQAVKIRNGVKPVPASAELAPGQPACPPLPTPEPGDLEVYPDVIGPAVTALKSIGTGANGRVAEFDICRAVQSWRLLRAAAVASRQRDEAPDAPSAPAASGPSRRPILDAPPAMREAPLVHNCDLLDEHILYPLGWYLSPTAAAGMRAAADKLGEACLPAPLAPPPPRPEVRMRTAAAMLP
ncbi:MAG: patatin-like phospholipase family protein [Thiohalocapsa sp.]|nr:patatin-like phospholipase family protein [Thiohalocapsa sp.]